MPKTKFQDVIFTIMMVVVMVYAMVVYNISLDQGGTTNKVFLYALSELPMMCGIGFVLEMLLVGPIAKKLAFRLLNPREDKLIFVILAISAITVAFMCPMMSLVAVVLFKGGFDSQMIATWVQVTVLNFPMAFFWQIFVAGPLVRAMFRKLFRN
jgi:hypothetical protein